MKKKIAVFASGSGTNAEEIIKYFEKSNKGEISLILSNNRNAFVLERAINHNIESVTFSRKEFYECCIIDDLLKEHGIDFIVLSGFMWLFPQRIVAQYEGRVVNIHPALLPAYGGKGMYGMHVHNAVVQNKETESGITIHYVNEHYDEGQIIFQAKVKISPNDTPDDVAAKVHQLEYAHFPRVIEECL